MMAKQMRFWDEGSGRVSKEALTDIGTETCLDEGDFRAGNWPGRFWHYGYGYERLRFELAQNPEQDVERGARSLFAVASEASASSTATLPRSPVSAVFESLSNNTPSCLSPGLRSLTAIS